MPFALPFVCSSGQGIVTEGHPYLAYLSYLSHDCLKEANSQHYYDVHFDLGSSDRTMSDTLEKFD